jgi:hypothetical protein
MWTATSAASERRLPMALTLLTQPPSRARSSRLRRAPSLRWSPASDIRKSSPARCRTRRPSALSVNTSSVHRGSGPMAPLKSQSIGFLNRRTNGRRLCFLKQVPDGTLTWMTLCQITPGALRSSKSRTRGQESPSRFKPSGPSFSTTTATLVSASGNQLLLSLTSHRSLAVPRSTTHSLSTKVRVTSLLMRPAYTEQLSRTRTRAEARPVSGGSPRTSIEPRRLLQQVGDV